VTVLVTLRVREREPVRERVACRVVGRGVLVTVLVTLRVREREPVRERVTVLDRERVTQRVKEVLLVTDLVATRVVGRGEVVRVLSLEVGNPVLVTVLETERVKERDIVEVRVAGRVVGSGDFEMVLETVRETERDLDMVTDTVFEGVDCLVVAAAQREGVVVAETVLVTERVKVRDFVTVLVANLVVGRGVLDVVMVAERQRDPVTDTVRVARRVVGIGDLEPVREVERVRVTEPERERLMVVDLVRVTDMVRVAGREVG
jgi:hypothetical protein